MYYKLRFWDFQFKALIDFHMVEANEFNWVVEGPDRSSVIIKRLDYDRTNDTDFLLYTFKLADEREVVYKVDNNPTGGTTVRLVKVADSGGIMLLLNQPDPVIEDVMRDCYLTGVKIMNTFWYC